MAASDCKRDSVLSLIKNATASSVTYSFFNIERKHISFNFHLNTTQFICFHKFAYHNIRVLLSAPSFIPAPGELLVLREHCNKSIHSLITTVLHTRLLLILRKVSRMRVTVDSVLASLFVLVHSWVPVENIRKEFS